MAEKGKSLVEMMKGDISRSNNGPRATFYLKKDSKCRVRFLNDMEDGCEMVFHDKWGEFNHPCMRYYGKACPNCDNKEARNTNNYIWTIYNYETKQRELFMYKANKASPVPQLIAMYENYGTICDRDYTVQRMGESTDTTYQVIPQDKSAFKKTGDDAKPFSKKEVLEKIYNAFPCDDLDNDKDLDEEDEEEGDAWEDDEDEEDDYEEKTPRELYTLCKEKGIKVEPKKSKEYYIKALRK